MEKVAVAMARAGLWGMDPQRVLDGAYHTYLIVREEPLAAEGGSADSQAWARSSTEERLHAFMVLWRLRAHVPRGQR